MVLRSTAERRRRNNLFSNFYPLLSRSSSSSNNINGSSSGNASPEVNNTNSSRAGSPGPSNLSSGSSSTAGAARNAASWPERPPSRSGTASPSVTTRLSTRSPTFQAPTSSSPGSPAGRTPRGLSRVQRMYDDQSVRSTRSSSRASSLAAVSPPVHSPSSVSASGEAIEYMDIDPESVGVTAQHYQPPPQSQTRPVMRPSTLSQSALSTSSGLVTTAASTTSTAAPIRESGPRTRSATAAALSESTSSGSSTVGTTAMGSDNHSLFSGLSNPRGGTSISSSLFPIRPDSDDENDDVDMDHGQQEAPSASLAQHPQGHTHTHAHTHGRRIAAPDLFAHIIMSLQESAATASATPSSTSSSTQTTGASEDSTSAASGNNGQQQDQDPLTGTARRPTATPLGRTRHRSSSMRGLFGYQPTNDLTDEERPLAPAAGSETGTTTGGAGTDAEAGAQRGDRNTERLSLQIPFFLRLLAEISRMPLNNPDETDADQTETGTTTDRPEETTATATTATATTADGVPQHTAHPSRPSTTTAENGADPLAENGAPPRLRRPNTTIRLIQFGHNARHPRPTGASNAPSAPTAAVGATGATGEEQGETEDREGHPAGTPGEESNETFIMFLSGPPPDGMDDTESNDSAAPGSDDPESARNRARHRSPWVVLTLSGAYLNSMMAAGADGEGGSTYDDLWMLANLIGPARPITTTQEAIDNAGFAVGRFEQALQGMRNVTTLGDGSKCLVCMSEYEEGEDMRALKCHHGFHQECIDKWLTTGANKCPVCRAAAVVTEPSMAAEPVVSVNPSEE
ncbi:hypothetical protein EC991_007950 [Linnemannia zychae]|nr:hypothetical protein EC991_007950 [Linnemannia zychae]